MSQQAFDIAFDNKQSLEEYQTRLAKRAKGINVRVKRFTDNVKAWIQENNPTMPRWEQSNLYADCSDMVNLAVTGLTAKEIRRHLDIPKGCDVRDYLPAEVLDEIAMLEKLAGRYISEDNLHPIQAVDLSIANSRVMQYRLEKIDRLDR